MQRDALALWFVSRHASTPWWLRAVLWAVVAYALSPIDLIPDFIPVLGLLDELVLLPLVVWAVARLIPADVLADARRLAVDTIARPQARAGILIVAAIWVAAALFVFWLCS